MPKSLRVAIIGTGMVANAAHLPALTHLRKQGIVDIVGCADIRESAAAETAKRYDIPAFFTDPQAMLDSLKPDFVAVTTPNMYHKKWTMAALRAGANVACEKPMALNVADAEEMFAVARECGRLLFPCQCMRWRNYMQTAKYLVDQGELGTPYFSDIAFIRRWGIPTWGMFHMKEHNYGGPFCDLGVHLIDSLLWVCGNPKVVAVSGSAYTKLAHQGDEILLDIAESGAYKGVLTPRPYDHREFSVEEFATGFMRLEGGFSVNFKFSWAINLPTTNLNMVICGDKGGFSLNDDTLYKNTGKYQSEIKVKAFDNRPYKGTPFEQHWYMYEHIMDVLDGKCEPLVQPYQTLEVTKAIQCFYRSAEEGREIRAAELG